MTAEKQTAKQAEETTQQKAQQREQTIKQKMKDEENRRRNDEREPPVTPDRAKAKAKSGPSPNRLAKTPPYPEGGELASGSTDNPESAHEPKGRRGRLANTQPKNQVPSVRKSIEKHKQETPKHDTEWDNSKSKAHLEQK